ncbi:hypothetical protein [Glycomyces rhizosphaerae]|uniref:Uncharacterized protein n=1 Tax=Glycomyces rhizosphaerae TaxID=2054422 RepID=A0ABV7Q5A3_9ACTN
MSDASRGLVQALTDGARERLKAGKAGGVSWARRVAPAPVVLRLAVALSLFIAAELAVPPEWAAAGGYVAAAALFALAAALLPAGIAPVAAILFVLAAWLLSSAMADGDASLWTTTAIACLLYIAHATAAVTQRFRTTTAMDGEIILTWARHLGLVLGSTVVVAGTLALFTAYFTGLAAGLVIGAGIVAAVTVIYVLARSLHKNP